MTNAGNNTVLNMMVLHEEALAKLYTVFCEKIPRMRDFWYEMACEEKAHAEVLRHLGKKLGKELINFNSRKTNIAALAASLDFISDRTNRFQKKDIGIFKSLAFALDQEQSMIENKYFEVFESDSPEIRKSLDLLREHTSRHIGRVKKAMESLKGES